VVSLALGVQVRHFVFAHEGGHAVVAEGHPLARVLEEGNLRRLTSHLHPSAARLNLQPKSSRYYRPVECSG
jgi:hypothetical protein